MKKSRFRLVITSLLLLCGLSFVSASLAVDKPRVEPERAGISAPLIDQGDYYIHPDGRKIKFYRKQDVYVIETKKSRQVRAKSISSMTRFKAQFGDRVEKISSHSLGALNVIRIDNSQQRTKSALPQSALKIQPSMLKSLDASISQLLPVLANEQGQGDILVTSKMLIMLSNEASASDDITALSKRFNLSILRRLKTSGALFQVESLSSISANTGDRFSFVRRIMNDPLVAWAQPVFKSKPIKTSFQPNDNLFDRQWHLSNTGQGGARCDTDCDANNAWGIGGANGVGSVSGLNTVIAIIDDGVQLDHEDLRIWINTAEVNGADNVDDDGNGCVDDFNGCDFVDDSLSALLNPAADLGFCTNALTATNDPVDTDGVKCRCQDTDGTLGPDGDPSPQATTACLEFNDQVVAEQDDHGTAVAGLAAARGNNSRGIAGVAYSAQILPIRLISEFDGDVNEDFCARAVEAMTYAGRHADVINNSWSIVQDTCPALEQVISLVVDGELTDASGNISKRPNLGSPVIFAAGNNASGWVKVTIPVTAGEHAYEWRFLRTVDTTGDAADSFSLDDSAWLDDIRFPDGSNEQFESGIPSGDNGFTLGCELSALSCDANCGTDFPLFPTEQCLLWGINTDANFSRSGNSAVIDHSANLSPCNHSYMNIIKDGPAGDVSFWIWVSTDLQTFADKVEFLVDGQEQLSFGDLARQVDNGVAYPANLPKVIAVGASDAGDLSGDTAAGLQFEERTSYSQYGAELDVLAPSSNQHLGIVTTDRYSTPGVIADGFNASRAIDNEANPGRYTDNFGGTSASAPIVAGIAAAMIASDTSISAADVELTLQATSDKIGRQGPGVYTADANGNTRSNFYGYGRVNMLNALQSVQGLPISSQVQVCTPESFSYTPARDLLLPNFAPQAATGMCPALGPRVEVDEFCFPIVTQNNRAAVICL